MKTHQNIFKRIWTGLKNRPGKFFKDFFFISVLLWSLIEPFIGLTGIASAGYRNYFIYASISLIISLIRVIPSKEIRFRLKNTNQTIDIKFGDIFEQQGCTVISVNEFFDSEIGKIVSPNSLHGKLIQNIIQDKNKFDTFVNESLSKISGESIVRSEGKNVKYPLGTTAEIDFGRTKYFLLAFCKTNIDTLKAYTHVSDMWIALEGLWKSVRDCSNGCNTNLALLGHGLSGVGLPPTQLLQIILMSILKAVKQNEIGCDISIIIHPSLYEDINLDLVKSNWD